MLLNFMADASSFNDQILAWVTALFGSNAATAVSIFKIIGINIVLSGDNAVVIALACRSLPASQRKIGIALGAGAAIILRILFTLIVQQLLDIPFLKVAGGLLLFWIAVKLLLTEEASEDSVASGSSLWEAVKIIAVADVVMSLDNVLAIAAAAHGNTSLIVLGLLISIPLVVFGSTLIMGLLTRYPVLVWGGAALLGWISGELIAQEGALLPAMTELSRMLSMSLPGTTRLFEIAGAVLVLLVGWLIKRRGAHHATSA